MTVPGTRDHEAALVVKTPKGTTLVLNDVVGNIRDASGVGGWMLGKMGFAGKQAQIPKIVKMVMIKDKSALRAQLLRWAEIDSLSAQVKVLKEAAPASDNAQAIAKYAEKTLGALAKRYPEVESDIGLVKDAAAAVSDFVASLTDNPGRRVLSIYFGMLLGLGVATQAPIDRVGVDDERIPRWRHRGWVNIPIARGERIEGVVRLVRIAPRAHQQEKIALVLLAQRVLARLLHLAWHTAQEEIPSLCERRHQRHRSHTAALLRPHDLGL